MLGLTDCLTELTSYLEEEKASILISDLKGYAIRAGLNGDRRSALGWTHRSVHDGKMTALLRTEQMTSFVWELSASETALALPNYICRGNESCHEGVPLCAKGHPQTGAEATVQVGTTL